MKKEILENLALIYVKKNLSAGDSPATALGLYEKALKEMQDILPHWEPDN